MKAIEPKLLKTNLLEILKTAWSTKIGSGRPISGRKFIVEAIDCNYSSNNRWHVWVEEPDRCFSEQGIVISLDKDWCPDRASVRRNLIWRKSLARAAENMRAAQCVTLTSRPGRIDLRILPVRTSVTGNHGPTVTFGHTESIAATRQSGVCYASNRVIHKRCRPHETYD